MSDDFDYPGAAAPPPGSSAAPPPVSPADSPTRVSAPPARRKTSASPVGGWLVVAVIVLVLAAAGGLFTAWIVANMRAVAPPVALASATPTVAPQSVSPSSTGPQSSSEPTDGPRFTPTPLPTVEVTPAPFTYVVGPGDKLVNIAAMFQVNVQDIIDLNDIKNPDHIFVGQELLIPGYGIQPTPKPSKKPR